MQRVLGAAAAVLTWLGWMTISPALGFPTVGTGAMINRAIFPKIPEAGHKPDFWLGWTILIAALIGAIAVFFILERLGLVRPSIRTGVIYGAVLWLLTGLAVMPLLAFIQPTLTSPPGVPPDPMHATVMMYSLGPLAAAGALVAWVLFGAVLGATATATGRIVTTHARAPTQ